MEEEGSKEDAACTGVLKPSCSADALRDPEDVGNTGWLYLNSVAPAVPISSLASAFAFNRFSFLLSLTTECHDRAGTASDAPIFRSKCNPGKRQVLLNSNFSGPDSVLWLQSATPSYFYVVVQIYTTSRWVFTSLLISRQVFTRAALPGYHLTPQVPGTFKQTEKMLLHSTERNQMKKNPITAHLELIPWTRGRGGREPTPQHRLRPVGRMLVGRAARHSPPPPIAPAAARVAMAFRSEPLEIR